jgi:hypothetical protein
MNRPAIALAALLTPTAAAHADWQYTKWGMTVDQVSASSKGKMIRCGMACDKQRTETDTALLYAPYQSGEFEFTAFAFFNNESKKLTSVSLRLDDRTKGYQLIAALKAKYGPPSSESGVGSIMAIVQWHTPADRMDVTLIGGVNDHSATLTYRPRLTNSTKGL